MQSLDQGKSPLLANSTGSGSQPKQKKKKAHKGETWKEILSNPFSHFPIIIFLCGGCFGLFSLLLYFLGFDKMDVMTCVALTVLGLYACYEIRLIVKFRVQLQHLKRLEQSLENTTQDLEDQLDELSAQNDALKNEVKEIEENVQNIEGENDELSQTVNELTASIDEFSAKNDALHATVQNLDDQNRSLQSKCVELNVTGDKMREELTELQLFKENLSKHAESQDADMLEIMKQVNDITAQLETTIQDQEAALLAQIQTSIEFKDGDETMSKEEYETFVNRLPKKYKDRLQRSGKSFATWKGNDDAIDFNEAQQMIDFLMNNEMKE